MKLGLNIIALIACAITVFIPSGVEGIWCYQCNSRTDAECEGLTVNSTKSIFYKECSPPSKDFNGSELFCRKIVQKIHDRDGLIRIVRKCGWVKGKKDCYSISNMGHKDEVCQCFKDGCNTASASSIPVFTLLFSVLSVFLLRLRYR